jgi:hypothetical protein
VTFEEGSLCDPKKSFPTFGGLHILFFILAAKYCCFERGLFSLNLIGLSGNGRWRRASLAQPRISLISVECRPAKGISVMTTRLARAGLLPALLICHVLGCHVPAAHAQTADQPPVLALGNAVVTGFSGIVAPDPRTRRPAGKTALDATLINPLGPSARIVDLANPGYVWDGRFWQAAKPRDILAKDTGQVFGVALDDQPAPNIYLAATSAYGLHIVRRLPGGGVERLRTGRPGAQWQDGQFGLALQGGPGSIYKVDGRTGAVTLFANVMLESVPNPGPALGNLAYDPAHKQLFASDLYTGMIHRFAIGDGAEQGAPFDHGVTARTAAGLPPAPFERHARLNIAQPSFDSTNPDTWGFAAPERRVWGVAVHGGRLFYSVRNGSATEGPQIWSVGIAPDGSFSPDARWELDVPAQPGPYPVSDIAFSQRGAMILAQRAPIAGSYAYTAFTKPGEPRVLRFWLENPDNPATASRWIAAPEEYAVGFAGNYRNTNGGVALGYGYGQSGRLAANACEVALWTTAQNIRVNPALQARLRPGGPMIVHGLQGVPAQPVRSFNEPPWTSYAIDYDDRFDDPDAAGHMGSVRILSEPCQAVAYGGPGANANPPYVSGPSGGGDGGECVGPDCRPVRIDLAIDKDGATTPAPEVNAYSFKLTISNIGAAFNAGSGVITVNDVVPANMTFTAITASAGWTCTAAPVMAGNAMTCSYAGGPIPAGTAVIGTISITAQSLVPPPFPAFTNCATVEVGPGTRLRDTDPRNNRDCVTIKKPPPPLNVAIEKTGRLVQVADMPMPNITHFSYTLAVTNIGAAFTGTGVVTVTDVVPANMTFTSINGTPNWTCPAGPLTAGQSFTCTYSGTGPAAPGAFMGSIAIAATATGKGPWTNCADTAIAAAAGTDTDLSNNRSCITLTIDGKITPDNPPPIPRACGVNVIFVVDESGSIESAGATWTVKQALINAASIFNNNGSKAAVVHFSDNAQVVLAPLSTPNYSVITTGYAPVLGTGTNWEAGLAAARTLLPSPNTVIVFITDGTPTAYLDPAGNVQYTTNTTLATNEAIPVVNQIYAAGVPILGIGIGGINSNLLALLGGNVQGSTYGGLSSTLAGLAHEFCPGLTLTKTVSPGYINYYNNPGPHQVDVTLTLTNSAGPLTNVVVQDALPAELSNPTAFVASAGTASGNPVNWTIPNLAAGATETLTFKVTVSPSSPPPTGGGMHCIKNYAQVFSVGTGTINTVPGNMANAVTGPVHETDESSAQVCIQDKKPVDPEPCTEPKLWVNKTIPTEVCRPSSQAVPSSSACTFTITVTAKCTAFNGPVRFGEGVFSGSSTVSVPIASVTSTPSTPWTCASTTPTSCVANVSLAVNQSITFTVTLGGPIADGNYRNCFLADGKTPMPSDFNSAYADVNPTSSTGGGWWGHCVPFVVTNAAGMVCPPGTAKTGERCLPLPPVGACAPPMVSGPTPGSCVCPQGTRLRGRECVKIVDCRAPMIPNAAGSGCACPQGTVLRGRECRPLPVCRPPLVRNAAGTACVCPQGMVQRGRQCVRPIECRPPARPNRAGTACLCPQGMTAKGRECVPQRIVPRFQREPRRDFQREPRGDFLRGSRGGGEQGGRDKRR